MQESNISDPKKFAVPRSGSPLCGRKCPLSQRPPEHGPANRIVARQGTILCAVVLFLLLQAAGNGHAADDTVKHFAISALCGAGSETLLHHKMQLGSTERVFFATAIGTIPGLAKELADSTEENNRFDGGDLAADIVGAFAGAVVSNFFNNAIQVRIESGRERKSLAFAYPF